MVRSEDAEAFDLQMALGISIENYTSLSSYVTGQKIGFTESLTDVNGDLISEEISYVLFILTRVTEDAGVEGILSTASKPMVLEKKTTVRDFIKEPILDKAYADMIVDAEGNIYQSGRDENRIHLITPAGEVQTFVSIDSPTGLDFDNNGNLYVASADGSIKKITPDGSQSEFTKVEPGLEGIVFDGSSNFYVCNCTTGSILRVDVDGNASTLWQDDGFSCPISIDFSGSTIYFLTLESVNDRMLLNTLSTSVLTAPSIFSKILDPILKPD